ncbi:telomerase RNA component interacting RNase isoform 1-T1 [Tautogolabrus adspersus]
MDSKRAHSHSKPQSSGGGGGGSSSSSGDSSCGSPASPSRSPAPAPTKAPAVVPGGNAFANDGSFMEMFKKKMEEQQRKQETGGGASATEQGQTPVEKKPPPVASFSPSLAVHLKGSYNGFSLLSPNPGGEAQRRCVPKDRHGCEEAERRLRSGSRQERCLVKVHG